MLKNLAEYREAYAKAKQVEINSSKPTRSSRARTSSREANLEKLNEENSSHSEENKKEVTVPDVVEISTSNMFYGKVPRKTIAFETYSRIHEKELEAIGDPTLRHFSLSKKIKSDYAAQSAQVCVFVITVR